MNRLPLTQETDDYQTPVEAIRPLLPYLSKKQIIWECACGEGQITKYLQQHGYNVISTDKNQGQNFFTCQKPNFDIIITNPPYSFKNEFLMKCYALQKPFALLMPLTSLETELRQTLYRKYGLEILFFNKRIRFKTPDGREGKDSSPWFASAWFCYKMLPQSIVFTQI